MNNLFVYGDGKIWTQQGDISGTRCLTIRRMEEAMPVGSVPSDWKKECTLAECDCVLAFKTIESARTLQDELNELIAKWSKETATVVPFNP